jgi:hypothetical protein
MTDYLISIGILAFVLAIGRVGSGLLVRAGRTDLSGTMAR